MRAFFQGNLGTRSLELGKRTLIMGIVNVTPDSFSDGGLYLDSGAAIEHALQLLGQGADIVDVGGESTRPGAIVSPSSAGSQEKEAKGKKSSGIVPTPATALSAEEEVGAVVPVVTGPKKARPAAVVSIAPSKTTLPLPPPP